MARLRAVFHYPKTLISTPIVSKLAREFDLDFNILRANITPDSAGLLVLELAGAGEELDRALAWAAEQGVAIQALAKDVVRDEARCTQCGACVTVCPTGALRTDPLTHEVLFDADECVACELCVPACPPRAMTLSF